MTTTPRLCDCSNVATVKKKRVRVANGFCACGNPSVKQTADGQVCRRCLEFEKWYFRQEVAGIKKRTDLEPFERGFGEHQEALTTHV